MRSLIFLCLLTGTSLAWADAPDLNEIEVTEVACETCHVPALVGPLQPLYDPGWVVSLNTQYSDMATALDGSQKLPNLERQRLTSAITQLNLGYNFNQEWGLQLNVPYIDRSFRRTAGQQLESGRVAGLGDMTLAARFTPISRFEDEQALVLNFQAGLKLPSGSSAQLGDFSGHSQRHNHGSEEHHHASPRNESPIRPHAGHHHDDKVGPEALAASLISGHDLALGSGSLDGLLGSSLFFRQDALFLSAGAQYALRTQGSHGYRFGNAFTWNLSPGALLIHEPDQLVGLQLNLSGEHKQADSLQGRAIGHASDSLFLGPQFFWAQGSSNFQAGLDLPIQQQTQGTALVPDYRLRLQLNWKL